MPKELKTTVHCFEKVEFRNENSIAQIAKTSTTSDPDGDFDLKEPETCKNRGVDAQTLLNRTDMHRSFNRARIAYFNMSTWPSVFNLKP